MEQPFVNHNQIECQEIPDIQIHAFATDDDSAFGLICGCNSGGGCDVCDAGGPGD